MTGTILVVQTDTTREDQVENLAAQALARFGRIDVWFNNGRSAGSPLWTGGPAALASGLLTPTLPCQWRDSAMPVSGMETGRYAALSPDHCGSVSAISVAGPVMTTRKSLPSLLLLPLPAPRPPSNRITRSWTGWPRHWS
jgi:NAD(P)-dependent dehydrogenase (short-subunit alcohol dehydrogenase family)